MFVPERVNRVSVSSLVWHARVLYGRATAVQPAQVLRRFESTYSHGVFGYYRGQNHTRKAVDLTLGCTKIPSTNVIQILRLYVPNFLTDCCGKLFFRNITEPVI